MLWTTLQNDVVPATLWTIVASLHTLGTVDDNKATHCSTRNSQQHRILAPAEHSEQSHGQFRSNPAAYYGTLDRCLHEKGHSTI